MEKVQDGIIKSDSLNNQNDQKYKTIVSKAKPLAFLSPIKQGYGYHRHTNKRVTASTENEPEYNKTFNNASLERKELEENFQIFVKEIEVKKNQKNKVICSKLKDSSNFSDDKSLNVIESFISRESQVKNIINSNKARKESSNKFKSLSENSNSESIHINALSYNSDSTYKNKKKSSCFPFFCF